MKTIKYESRIGKFEGCGNVGEYFFDLSQNGCDNECGDASIDYWYGLIILMDRIAIQYGDADNRPMQTELARAAIIAESSQGFIDCDTYGNIDDARAQWEKIEKSVEDINDFSDCENF